MSETERVLDLTDVRKTFISRSPWNPFSARVVRAVDGVSLHVVRGETLALVGESGCGKSTLARIVAHLHRIDSGRIRLLGKEVQDLNQSEFRPLRRHVQMVFQNPLTSFDPVYTIGYSINEVLRLSKSGHHARAEVDRLLTEVGLSPRFRSLRPNAVSGGELQRAAIARALAVHPELVVLDEPTSALDMSIQGQVLSLLTDLQGRHGLSYLLATHDLRVVEMVAHRVIVMYLGQIVETAPTAALFARPLHPYTQGLLYSRNLSGRTELGDRTIRIRGTLRYPEPGYLGCRLVGRCPLAVAECRQPQALTPITSDHAVRCWKGVAGVTTSTGRVTADPTSTRADEPKPLAD